jgi:hypothetical protein
MHSFYKGLFYKHQLTNPAGIVGAVPLCQPAPVGIVGAMPLASTARPKVGRQPTMSCRPSEQNKLFFVGKVIVTGILGAGRHDNPVRNKAWVQDDIVEVVLGNDKRR